MSKNQHIRSRQFENEMIADLLEMPIDELEEEFKQSGHDLQGTRDRLSSCFERAQQQVISAKVAMANSMVVKPMRSQPSDHNSLTLTLAARSATRPVGLNDPTVDDDLKELRSEEWDDD